MKEQDEKESQSENTKSEQTQFEETNIEASSSLEDILESKEETKTKKNTSV